MDMDNNEEMETEQEHRFCIICRKIYQLINLPITIVNNKILFDNCLHLFKIEEGSFPDAYKWKWDAKYDLPNFCDDCGEEINILSQLEGELDLTTKKIDELIKQTKSTILKTTSLEKLESSRKSPILFAFEYSHCTQVIDYFRSVAIHDWNPSVLISSLDQTTAEIKELKFDKSILALSQEDIDEYIMRFGDKFKCKVCSAVIKERRNFTRHINVVHKDIRRFECSFCHLQNYERSEISCHIQKTHRRIKDADWLSHVTVLETGQLSLTDDEREFYSLDLGDSYQCKVCSVIIKDERNVSRHVNQVHKAMKRFQCNLCFESFYSKLDCQLHLCQNHNSSLRDNRTPFCSFVEQKPEEVIIEQSKLKCLLCYQCLEESGVQISSEVFSTLCSLLTVVILENVLGALLQNLPILCTQCCFVASELHNLYVYRENNQMQRQIEKRMLKLKTDILLALMGEEKNFDSKKSIHGEVSIAEKAEYFRRLIVQDLSPVVPMLKLKALVTYNSSRPPQSRALTENSVMKMVTDDEIININPELGDKLVPLSDEEFQYYIKIEESKYNCRICSKVCETHKGAVEHCNRFHKKVVRYQCKYCDMKFYLKTDCASHIITDSTHKRERAHVADEIEKRIMTAQSLEITAKDGVIELIRQRKKQKWTDSVIKVGNKYKCAICSLVTRNRSSNVSHQKKIHLRLDRYKCEFCDYKNLHRTPVVYHVRTVHSEKVTENYLGNCKRVKKVLSGGTVWRRREHNALLTGVEKLEGAVPPKVEDHYTVEGVNFVCNFCGRKFNMRYYVVSHLEGVHFAIRRYQCTACGMKFYNLDRCSRHLKKKHAEYYEGLKNDSVELKCVTQNFPKVDQKFIPTWENVPQQEDNFSVKKCDPFSNAELPFLIEKKCSIILGDSEDNSSAIIQKELPMDMEEVLEIKVEEDGFSSILNKNSSQEIKDEFYNFNGEERPVRLPMKGELEINVMPFLEVEDQFVKETYGNPKQENKTSGQNEGDLTVDERFEPSISKNSNKLSNKSPWYVTCSIRSTS